MEISRRLIETCGKAGGFTFTSTSMDEASPENVKAVFETVRRYGVYT